MAIQIAIPIVIMVTMIIRRTVAFELIGSQCLKEEFSSLEFSWRQFLFG